MADVSWWPTPVHWDNNNANGFNWGHWTEWDEIWYQQRMTEILTGHKNGVPFTQGTWRSKLKGAKTWKQVTKRVQDELNTFFWPNVVYSQLRLQYFTAFLDISQHQASVLHFTFPILQFVWLKYFFFFLSLVHHQMYEPWSWSRVRPHFLISIVTKAFHRNFKCTCGVRNSEFFLF